METSYHGKVEVVDVANVAWLSSVDEHETSYNHKLLSRNMKEDEEDEDR